MIILTGALHDFYAGANEANGGDGEDEELDDPGEILDYFFLSRF